MPGAGDRRRRNVTAVTEWEQPAGYAFRFDPVRKQGSQSMSHAIQFDIVVDGFRIPCTASAEAGSQARRSAGAPAVDIDAALERLQHAARLRFLQGAAPPVVVLREHLHAAGDCP
ncbi:hypothetical protein C7415_108241 [Cupriavidus alkaliphilus]|nr:hypothetical protein C7415_108241 [Cupriavidus alkaliphilus]